MRKYIYFRTTDSIWEADDVGSGTSNMTWLNSTLPDISQDVVHVDVSCDFGDYFEGASTSRPSISEPSASSTPSPSIQNSNTMPGLLGKPLKKMKLAEERLGNIFNAVDKLLEMKTKEAEKNKENENPHEEFISKMKMFVQLVPEDKTEEFKGEILNFTRELFKEIAQY